MDSHDLPKSINPFGPQQPQAPASAVPVQRTAKTMPLEIAGPASPMLLRPATKPANVPPHSVATFEPASKNRRVVLFIGMGVFCFFAVVGLVTKQLEKNPKPDPIPDSRRSDENYRQLKTMTSRSKAAQVFFQRGQSRHASMDYALARDDYSEAIRLDSSNATIHNDLAWLLATCPDARVRNGRLAVSLANKAIDLAGGNHVYADTLAAAYAECGSFDAAIKAQKYALNGLSQAELPAAQVRLKLYLARKPYRE